MRKSDECRKMARRLYSTAAWLSIPCRRDCLDAAALLESLGREDQRESAVQAGQRYVAAASQEARAAGPEQSDLHPITEPHEYVDAATGAIEEHAAAAAPDGELVKRIYI